MAEWKLSVDTDKIIHITEDDFEATITAVYTYGNQVVRDKMVQLFVPGSVEPIEPAETDENGRVTIDRVAIHTTAKKIVIEAQAVGYATRGRKLITLPWPEKIGKNKPAEIIPHVCGTDGDYIITYEVLNKDKAPISGIAVQISDATAKRRCRNLPLTDEKGTTEFSIKFKTKEKILEASVLGSGISTWLNLFNAKGE